MEAIVSASATKHVNALKKMDNMTVGGDQIILIAPYWLAVV